MTPLIEQLVNWVSLNYTLVVWIVLGIFLFSLIIFFIVILRLNRLAKQYRALMNGVDGTNLEKIIIHNTKLMEQVLLKVDINQDRLNAVEKMSKNSIQKISLTRFNAFDGIGGDLSYALVLLDHQGNGVVVSSIYGRDDARTYAKPIKKGKSTYPLSQEEEKVIENALKDELFS